jgi:hypothetical protein
MNTPKFSIPTPCHENWNSMTPDTQGRFCSQCSKTVVDFTGMANEDINSYIDSKEKGTVCGRFKGSQLHITPPANNPIRKMAMASLVVSVSASLNSCLMGAPMHRESKTATDSITATTDRNPIYLGEPALPMDKDTVAMPVQKNESVQPKSKQK